MKTRQLTRSRATRARSTARRRAGWMTLLGLSALFSISPVLAARPIVAVRLLRIATIELLGGDYLGNDGVVLQRSFHDCGPAALATLFLQMGITPPALDSLARLAGTTVRGTTLGGLARAARDLGVLLDAKRFTPARFTPVMLPCVAWIRGRHFVVVANRDHDGTLTILDPEIGAYRMPAGRFARDWSGEALVGSRDETVAARVRVTAVQ